MSGQIYSWFCKKCKKNVSAPLSGYPGEEHVHCPFCGEMRSVEK